MTKQDIRSVALAAATESAPHAAVGDFIESKTEDDGSQTFLFRSRLKGYVGWQWSVNLFEDPKTHGVTVSEVLLLPGEEALVAPDWVPWSERLADYKALQAELAAQAAAENEDGEDAEDAEDASDEDDEDEELEEEPEEEIAAPGHFTEDEVEAEVEAAEELAASADPEPAEKPKGKPNNGRGRFQRRRFLDKSGN